MKDIGPPDQTRERRQTVVGRVSDRAPNLLFSNSHLIDVSTGEAGLVVDALRLFDAKITLGRVISGGHEVALEDPDFCTVLIPEQGRIVMDIDGSEYGIAPGTLALVTAEKRRTKVVPHKGGLFIATTVLFPRSLFGSGIGEGTNGARGHSIREVCSPIGRHLLQLLPDLAGAVFRQRDRVFNKKARDEFIGLVGDLAADCGGSGRMTMRRGGGLAEFRRVSRAVDIMRARSDEPLSLASLAEELEITPRCLQISFEAVHGMSPRAYLQRARLEQALLRFLTGEECGSVTRVAMDCGFLHLGRFSQAYRKAFGELPSATLARQTRRHAIG